jgi:hypothetical protein
MCGWTSAHPHILDRSTGSKRAQMDLLRTSENSYQRTLVLLASLIGSSVVIWLLVNRWWLPACLLPILLCGFHYRGSLGNNWRNVLVGLVLAVLVVVGLQGLKIMRGNIIQPPEWDFLVFWLDGHVAAHGLNFYDPLNYQQLAKPLNLSREFTQEIVDVGFKYPPMTMLLFLPLGWFDPQFALMLWYLINTIVLIGDIFLLWRIFLGRSELIGLAWIAALVLLCAATLSTIAYAQTNGIVLLLLLLFWRDRRMLRGGIWLAIGLCVKPIVAFVLLYLLLRRRWRLLGSTLGMLAAIALLTLLVFGPSTFLSYLTTNPAAKKVPYALYVESVNQSLLATVLRATGDSFSGASPITQPVFVVLALVLAVITSVLIYRLPANADDWALAFTIPLALLLYPAALVHYSLLLLLPLLLLWRERGQLPFGIGGVVVFITLAYGLIGRGGNSVFLTVMLSWLALAGISFWCLKSRYTQTDGIEG